MKEYALSIGAPEEAILLEEHSMDTIGNAVFSKIDFCAPRGWRHISVVTSEFHLPRTSYIFRKVFGKGFAFSFIPTDSGLSALELKKENGEDRIFLDFTKRFLGSISDGDHASIRRLLMQLPGYNDTPHFSKENLLKLIFAKR